MRASLVAEFSVCVCVTLFKILNDSATHSTRTTSTLTARTITSLGMTFGTCVHAHKELACTANISTVHERIFLKFIILLSDINDKSKITPQLINNDNNDNVRAHT